MDRGKRHQPAAGPRESAERGAAAWTAVGAAAVAVVVVAGGAWALTRGGGDDQAGPAGPDSSSTTTASSPTDTTSGPSSPSSDDTSDSIPPVQPAHWPQPCVSAAKQAIGSGVAVMGPSTLPDGWKITGCRWSADTGWHMALTSEQGPLALDQRTGSVKTLLTDVLGGDAEQGRSVVAQGTGRWQSWADTTGHHALAKQVRTAAVSLSGTADADTLTRFADVLLTYEDAPPGPGDDAGSY